MTTDDSFPWENFRKKFYVNPREILPEMPKLTILDLINLEFSITNGLEILAKCNPGRIYSDLIKKYPNLCATICSPFPQQKNNHQIITVMPGINILGFKIDNFNLNLMMIGGDDIVHWIPIWQIQQVNNCYSKDDRITVWQNPLN